MKEKKRLIKFIFVIGILIIMYLYHTSRLNMIYKVCGDSNKIAKIEIYTEQEGIDKVAVTDKESIVAFSNTVSSLTISKNKNNKRDKEYILLIYPPDVNYYYSLAIPNGNFYKLYPYSKNLTPLYSMENYDDLLSWINKMKDK